ncbi:MAG: hypothetical protein NT069_07700 [Planctomycetota bacterium]|nr:hypothetical protein [Planctomycetota bacterium]
MAIDASGFEFFTDDGKGATPASSRVAGTAVSPKPATKPGELNLDMLDDEFDTVTPEEPAVKVQAAAIDSHRQSAPSILPFGNVAEEPAATGGFSNHLFFDFETVPDEDRMEFFGLAEIPEFTEKPDADCPPVEEACEWTVQAIESFVERENPEFTWLNRMVEAEQARGSGGPADKRKPRSGVFDSLKKSLKAREANLSAHAKRRKDMSVSPEMCRVVAVGWAIGATTPRSLVIGDRCNEFSAGQPITEKQIIEVCWNLIARFSPIVGFNVISFDMNVLRARSIVLGVNPLKILSDSPFQNRDVVDLAVKRFGKGIPAVGLKQLCKLYGVAVKRPDLDGGQVERMLAEDPGELRAYVESDIWATRDLFLKWRGFWTE